MEKKEAEIWDKIKILLTAFGIYQEMTAEDKLELKKEIRKCIKIINGAKKDFTIIKN